MSLIHAPGPGRPVAGWAIGGLVALALAITGCSASSPTEKSQGSDPAQTSTTLSAFAGVPPLPTSSTTKTSTAQVMDAASASLTLDPEERACVEGQLERDPDLANSLGTKPAESPRWNDLTRLASDCLNRVQFSAAFVASLQTEAGGTLDASTLGCLREGLAALSSNDVQKIMQAGLNPGTTGDPGVGERLYAVFDTCHVDRARLPGAPTAPPSSVK